MIYQGDLSDEHWSILEMFFPTYQGHCRPRIHSFRSIMGGIFYVVRTGCQWRMLPKCLCGARNVVL